MQIGEAIKNYRKKQGLTQTELAEKINKSTRMLRRYENGETVPSIKILDLIFNESFQELIYNKVTED